MSVSKAEDLRSMYCFQLTFSSNDSGTNSQELEFFKILTRGGLERIGSDVKKKNGPFLALNVV